MSTRQPARVKPQLTPLQQMLAEESDMSLFQRPNHDRAIGTALVTAQFGLLGLSLLPIGPALALPGWARAVGLALVGIGLVVGVLGLIGLGRDTRVHPIPAAGSALRTTGIYSVVRHPMYLAVMLCAVGVTVGSGRLLALLASCALAGVLAFKARFEERLLDERFGWEYATYASRVPAVIPRWPRRW